MNETQASDAARQALLTDVRMRLHADPRLLAGDQALQVVRGMLPALEQHLAEDIELLYELAFLYLLRLEPDSPSADSDDLLASSFFMLLGAADASAVPDGFETHFPIVRSASVPWTAASRAMKFWTAEGDVVQLAVAAALYRLALRHMPAHETAFTGDLRSNLSVSLRELFAITGNRIQIDESIDLLLLTLERNPDHAHRPGWFSNLASSFETRFTHWRSPADIKQTVVAARAAADTLVEATGGTHILNNLACTLQASFEASADLRDLDEAILVSARGLSGWSEDDPYRAALLRNSGNTLRMRYERTGLKSDLELSVARLRDAVDAQRERTHVSGTLANLASSLRTRYQLTGATEDLEEALSGGQRALDVAVPGQAIAGLHNDLSYTHFLRGHRFGNIDDYDRAVARAQDAVRLESADHGHWFIYAGNLANALDARYDATGAVQDLDDAITVRERLLEVAPTGHPGLPRELTNLAGSLLRRFDEMGGTDDLENALGQAEKAVAGTPRDDPWRAAHLSVFAEVLVKRFEAQGSEKDLAEARHQYWQAARSQFAMPRARVQAASQAGSLAQRVGDWGDAVQAYELAISLATKVITRGLHRDDQEHGAGVLMDVAANAVACCLQDGQNLRAVELWEEGRGLVFAQALHAKALDISEIEHDDPIWARDFVDLCQKLNESANTSLRPVFASEHRRAASTDLDALIERIRGKYPSFLRGTEYDLLSGAAAKGPVVLVNVSDVRSDAIILVPQGLCPVVVPLSPLTPERVFDYISRLSAGVSDSGDADLGIRRRGERDLVSLYEALWDVVAEPVCRALGGVVDRSVEGPPHLWWCLGGLLAFLPIHAAGRYGGAPTDAPQSVADFGLSSYTPTIRALLSARAEQHGARPSAVSISRALVVAMPETPGATDLPGVREEAHLVSSALGLRATLLVGERAQRSTVIEEMLTHDWLHLACHAVADIADPASSRLLLHDHMTNPLTARDVSQLALQKGTVAILSACSTAMPGAIVPDEGLHLSASFLLAGARHVLANLWPVSDRATVVLISHFYELVLSRGASPVEALDGAVRRLRSEWPSHPSIWGAYTHTGA